MITIVLFIKLYPHTSHCRALNGFTLAQLSRQALCTNRDDPQQIGHITSSGFSVVLVDSRHIRQTSPVEAKAFLFAVMSDGASSLFALVGVCGGVGGTLRNIFIRIIESKLITT